MNEQLETKTVGEIVAENARRSVVFERHGIDYCCAGKRNLSVACMESDLDIHTVVAEIEAIDRQQVEQADRWLDRSLTELADNIVSTHHAYLRENLPRIIGLAQKVNAAHGARDSRFGELLTIVNAFAMDLRSHMIKEEQILFPIIRKLDTATEPVASHCGSIANPIAVMEAEHEGAGAHLSSMRSLTDDYTPDAHACNTTRALIQALHDLETDMHVHVHKENSILFPRALAREQELLTTSSPK